MDSRRLTFGTLATVSAGVLAGLAANPTMRTFPELDWRARYRAAMQPDPVLQPGVSYYDSSVGWGGGVVPEPYRAPPEWSAISWREPPAYVPAPLPPEPERLAADMDEEMATARAIVASAMARSTPAAPSPAVAATAITPPGGESELAKTADAQAEGEADPDEPLAGG